MAYMKDIWNYLKSADKPIVLYGMGNGADKVISVCEKYGIKISGVFSSDDFVRRKTFHGMQVTNYKTAKAAFGDMIILLCFGTALPQVLANIKRIAAENEFFAPDVPVYGDTLFSSDYYNEHKNEFENIYRKLCDDTSKKTFENIINYKLSGDINCLFACETDSDEPYKNFLSLNDTEIYLDLGAYRGDTVFSFLNRVKGYKEIIAVEPDVKSFGKLCAATENIKNIRNINALAGEKIAVTEFSMNGSRGAGKPAAKKKTNVIPIDSLHISPSFIKMDIEGFEAKAISGGQKTISAFRPKMQIAAYHRSVDLIDIPRAVLSFRDDYKIYLRHNPCLPAWDVNYFFV